MHEAEPRAHESFCYVLDQAIERGGFEIDRLATAVKLDECVGTLRAQYEVARAATALDPLDDGWIRQRYDLAFRLNLPMGAFSTAIDDLQRVLDHHRMYTHDGKKVALDRVEIELERLIERVRERTGARGRQSSSPSARAGRKGARKPSAKRSGARRVPAEEEPVQLLFPWEE